MEHLASRSIRTLLRWLLVALLPTFLPLDAVGQIWTVIAFDAKGDGRDPRLAQAVEEDRAERLAGRGVGEGHRADRVDGGRRAAAGVHRRREGHRLARQQLDSGHPRARYGI